jgi:hypothetical protein
MATCRFHERRDTADEEPGWWVRDLGVMTDEDSVTTYGGQVYCWACGDKLLATGAVESRAEVAKDGERLDKLDILRGSGMSHACLWAITDAKGNRVLWDASVKGVQYRGKTLRALADALPAPEEADR